MLGEAVPATKRFGSFGLSGSPQYTVGNVEIPGVKYSPKHFISGESMEYSLEGGTLSYDEVVWPLCGIVRKSIPAVVSGGTTAQLWNFDSDPFGYDDVQTYTVEYGIRGYRDGASPYAYMNEWEFSAERNGEMTEMSGSMAGWPVDQSVVTSDLDAPDFVPVIPSQFNVYLDYAPEDIGTTLLENAFSFGFSFGDRKSQAWFFNRAIPSFSGTSETRPSTEVTLAVADEFEPVDEILARLREGSRIYVRFEAIGPQIEMSTDATPVPINHRFTADFCCAVSDGPSEGDVDDNASQEFTFATEPEPDWGTNGSPFEITVVNEVAALA